MSSLDAAGLAKLQERAARLARRPEGDETRRLVELEVVVLGSGEGRVAVPVGDLREIVRTPAITRLPALPGWILGLIQIRGELLCVVEPSTLLGSEPPKTGRLLAVVESRGRAVGLAADRLVDLRVIYRDELSKSVDGAEHRSGLLRATTRDLLPILDIERLLDDPRLIVGAADGEPDEPITADPPLPPTE